MINIIQKAVIKAGGQTAVANATGVKQPSVAGWIRRGVLPRTEYTGETNYAQTIAKLAKDKRYRAKVLLDVRRPKQ